MRIPGKRQKGANTIYFDVKAENDESVAVHEKPLSSCHEGIDDAYADRWPPLVQANPGPGF